MHRFRNPSQTQREIYAKRSHEREIQDLESGGEHTFRVPDHDPYRPQHTPAHDEGNIYSGQHKMWILATLSVWFEMSFYYNQMTSSFFIQCIETQIFFEIVLIC